jgi:peptidoglycan LD-endopeptidase LytH
VKARLTLAARILLVAALLGVAFVFIGQQRDGGTKPSGLEADTAKTPKPVSRTAALPRSSARIAGRGPLPCLDKAGLIVPVQGVARSALVNTFDDARSDERLHDAIDIMAPTGTPVIAAAAGRVEKLLLSANGGNTVYVRSTDRRTIHYYAHLDQYASGLREHRMIAQGQLLGTVGYSGNADPAAPHLHFALMVAGPDGKWWDHGAALNPYPYLAKPTPRQRKCETSRQR